MDTHRGHAIVLSDAGWRYADRQTIVSDDPDRDCGRCGRANTADGHDACIAGLPDTANACCGHGEAASAYVQLIDGSRIEGDAALQFMAASGGAPC